MNQPLTTDERNLINHWSMFGSAAIVEKVGRSWMIREFGSVKHPMVYKTKRQAMDAGTAMVLAKSNRARGI